MRYASRTIRSKSKPPNFRIAIFREGENESIWVAMTFDNWFVAQGRTRNEAVECLRQTINANHYFVRNVRFNKLEVPEDYKILPSGKLFTGYKPDKEWLKKK
jgi:hypothetical protein